MKNSWKNWTKASGELMTAVGKACVKGIITAAMWIPGSIIGLYRGIRNNVTVK